MKTTSLWGTPPSRYYRFLQRLDSWQSTNAVYDLGVLGCADGKFVVPAARRGMKVLAVDIDNVALYGGEKPGVGGAVDMPGLAARLDIEQLAGAVEVVCGDFSELSARSCRGVFVSGAIQYSFNAPKTAAQMMRSVMGFVAEGGLLYVDYMLPFEPKYVGRPNCPDARWWAEWPMSVRGWTVVYNRVLPPVIDSAHVEYPEDHYHQWGHLLMWREPPSA